MVMYLIVYVKLRSANVDRHDLLIILIDTIHSINHKVNFYYYSTIEVV